MTRCIRLCYLEILDMFRSHRVSSMNYGWLHKFELDLQGMNALKSDLYWLAASGPFFMLFSGKFIIA